MKIFKIQIKVFLAVAVGFGFLISETVVAQVEFKNRPALGVPQYQLELINVRSPKDDKSRLNVYLQILYDELQFVRSDSGYCAEYEVTISILGKNQEQIDGKIWSEKVPVKEYEATNSRDLTSFTTNYFVLDPGEYEFYLSLLDKDSKKSGVTHLSLKLRDFPKDQLSVSDITMLSDFTMDSLGIKSIRPLISLNLQEELKNVFAYYEIYSPVEIDSYDVAYEIKIFHGKKLAEKKFRVSRDSFRTLAASSLDGSNITSGRYLLKLTVSDGKNAVSVEKILIIRWSGLPYTVYDLDTAIEQLKYIASGTEIKKIKKAKGEEKTTLFKNFWADRDPTPGTLINEHMEEYYRRIHLANESFSGFREGWKSDMGMVFIILGQPNDIERHPFEPGSKPYQIWYYYELNREFVFVDETGFGEYRLLARYWEELYRDMGFRP